MIRSTLRFILLRTAISLAPAIPLASLVLCWSSDAGALDQAASLDPIVVTARKVPIPDEELTRRVESAFNADRFFYGTQVTVRAKNGVVYLDGSVWEDWDMRLAIKIARRIPGVKRVVNNLDIGPDGT